MDRMGLGVAAGTAESSRILALERTAGRRVTHNCPLKTKAPHLRTGTDGERIALEHLRSEGYDVLATNWRSGRDEIDIVARRGRTLVVVEVKTRSTDRFGEPFEAVGPAKQRKLSRAAEALLDSLPQEEVEIRFDVIGIVLSPNGHRISHIEAAFYHTPDEHTE